jgi:transposase
MKKKAKKPRAHLMEQFEAEFRLPFITGEMSSKQIIAKYYDRGARQKNVENYLRTRGLTQLKREYKQGKSEKIQETNEKEIAELVRQEQMKELLATRKEEAIQHQQWVDRQLKTSRERLDTDPESLQKLDRHMANLKAISDLATSHYGLDKTDADQHAVQVQIIMGLDTDDIKEKPVTARVVSSDSEGQ